MKIKDRPVPSDQEVFDKVAAHLLKQGERCYDPYKEPDCRYRNGELKCAIGCLIPSNRYSENMEDGSGPKELLNTYENMNKFLGENICLLDSLQHIHDCLPVNEWRKRLRILAIEQDLKWNH